ncbi:probable choline kinase 1 [Salvia splendens]|uniref:probable choline kinase 1 n=1 Tax=Salvia splendens TaxID=180675 RepID=UPI001C278D39|nr:probable choline kinase 1 [Salvia splendens]XP_042017195.1 probable choline kinase 1 [Salvia splendens]XP_042017196.1 probable choline kinase 1 [Salvia splendens]XP_042017197.1 probable choline kinase 1 [Salvia splendens]XP_042017198.1 probable choline kinase 1 [Salvia splendens]XP_042017199.1 probable choline kinase 1 [Salvia splendens]
MAVKTNGFVEGIWPEGLRKLLMSLASSWGEVFDVEGLKVVHLSGAMTNVVYRLSWPIKKVDGEDCGGGVRTVLVRVYGDGLDLFFNREEEIRTFECLSEHGYGPKLLGHFKVGRVEEFIYARTLSSADLRNPETSALIAAKMRDFHELEMPPPKEPLLWNRLRNWLSEAKSLCSPGDANEYKLHILEQEITLLEEAISMDHQEIGFCHNDMQYGNIMIDDNDSTITIIDYEYASYNPIAYDIANHFCEMAANYHTDTPHTLDYTKYPGEEERKRFIRKYLSSSGKEEASETSVDQLADDVERYTLANHLFWGLWGLISAYVSHIEFDYKEYARQRFEQYWLRKPAILKGGGGADTTHANSASDV